MSSINAARSALCVLTAAALVSCGAGANAASFRKETSDTEKVMEASVSVSTEDISVPADSSSEAEESSSSEDTSSESAAEDSSSEAPSEEQTAEEKPKKTVKLDKTLLENRSFTAEDFPKKVCSNKKLGKALDKIDDICGEYGGNISFAYLCADTGTSVWYNADRLYGSCSTVKAPYCEYLLESGINLKEKLTVNELWDRDVGTVADAGLGKTYTAKELIRLAITESDNSAYLTLVNRYGREGFNEQSASLGVQYKLWDGYIFTECSARDLLRQYAHIFEQGFANGRVEWLTRLMQKTDHETQITAQLADKYPVSHKYGTDHEQDCYHDCAICYADTPFILVIMTEQTPETEESDKVFRRLAKQFDLLNEQLYVKGK